MTRSNLISFYLFPVAVLILYTVPAAVSSVVYGDQVSFLIFALSVISTIVISIFSLLSHSALIFLKADIQTRRSEIISKAIVLIFFTTYLVLAIDFGGFPVSNFFLEGGNPAILRAEFSKEKEGFVNAALYVRSMILKGLLPLAILVLVEQRQRLWVFWSLAAFTLVSVLTYEKAIVLWIGIPLALYYYLKARYWSVIRSMTWSILIVVIVSGLQLSGAVRLYATGSYQSAPLIKNVDLGWQHPSVLTGYIGLQNPSVSAQIQLDDSAFFDPDILLWKASLKNVKNYRFLLHTTNVSTAYNILGMVLNRAFWIPFITAYDAILFWREEFNEKLLFFSINRHLARLFGSEFSNIEREVFRFQFGGNFDSTGNANFVFFVEAYIAFGLVGVLSYGCLIGLILGLLGGSSSKVVVAAGFAPIFSFLNASFISSLFSGGVVFFILFVMLIPKWEYRRC